MGGDDPVKWRNGLAEAPPAVGFPPTPGVLRLATPAALPDRSSRVLEPARPIRVLVIDRCDEDAALVDDLLGRAENARFRTERAPDPAGALARLARGEHDVALIDHGPPGQDGLQLLRKARRRGVAVPLIVTSAEGEPGLDVAAIEAGASDFVDKEEFAVERLERAIRLAIARDRLRRGAKAPTEPAPDAEGREACLARVGEALARARRRGSLAAVLIVELESAAGRPRSADADPLPRLLGARLRRLLRETDTVARLAPDRHLVLLEDLGRPEHAAAVVEKLRTGVAVPLTVDGVTLTPKTRFGWVLYPDEGTEPARLVAMAETRLGRAVAGRVVADARTCHALRPALERALRDGTLDLLFQPQVTLCEPQAALAAQVRWQGDASGALDFPALVDLADRSALLEPLTDWLIAAACAQAARWLQGGVGALHVAVPLLSRRQLGHGDLARRLDSHLVAAGLAPAALEIELDETLLLPLDEAPTRTVAGLRELGVRIAVAGFGAGISSLAILRDLPLHTVKLARRLLAGVPHDPRRTRLARAVVNFAVDLDLRVVAEGVDTHGQLQLLREAGCHAVQALFDSPALPPAGCADWLRQATRRP